MTSSRTYRWGNDGITGKYLGSSGCALCHVNTHSQWADTLHAHALESLEAIGQDENEDCIGCHTVGFGEEGGFVDRATTNDLAGVGCESCHGAARDHAQNLSDVSLRPPTSIAADICGACHTGAHHPTYDEWETSGHAAIDDHVVEGLVEGSRVNSCGICHAGDAFVEIAVYGETVEEDRFLDMEPNQVNPITCAVCHDPHMRTGNAAGEIEDGRDYQLRYPEAASPIPTNTVDAATNPARFNICGQCHHSRGRDWTATSRGPHHSVQSNIYIGEMPVPEIDDEPQTLVPSRVSVHLRADQQCATCHLYRQDFESETAPAIAGHTFMVNYEACNTSGCHASSFEAETRGDAFRAGVESRIEDIKDRLDEYVFDADPSTLDWAYTSDGGPSDQAGISENVMQVRFLIAYIESDGSGGVHNPAYVESMLDKAEDLLTAEGL